MRSKLRSKLRVFVNTDIVMVLVILAVALVLFISEVIRMDLVALLVLCALAVTGLVTPNEAISGFSNAAVITVWAMFILSDGLHAYRHRKYSGQAGLGDSRAARGSADLLDHGHFRRTVRVYEQYRCRCIDAAGRGRHCAASRNSTIPIIDAAGIWVPARWADNPDRHTTESTDQWCACTKRPATFWIIRFYARGIGGDAGGNDYLWHCWAD